MMTNRTHGALLLVAAAIALAQPAEADELKWPKKLAGQVADAISSKENDPIAALMAFQKIRESSKKLKPEHLAFLEEEIRGLRASVLERLRSEYSAAKERRDIRGVVIAQGIASKVDESDLEVQPLRDIEELLRLEQGSRYEVWRVRDVTGGFLSEPYSEGSASSGRFTAQPADGFRLLRVTATITNVDGVGDDPTSLWVLSTVKKLFAVMAAKEAGPEPARWLDNELMYVMAAGPELFPCSVVVEYRGGRGVGGMVMYTQTAKILPPRFLAEGESLQVEVICSVPERVREPEFLVLGAESVPIAIEGEEVGDDVPATGAPMAR